MKLHSLEIKNFRAIEDISLDFTDLLGRPQPINLIVGPNGSGKTSILDAIHVVVKVFENPQNPELREGLEYNAQQLVSGRANIAQITFEYSIEKDEAEAINDVYSSLKLPQKFNLSESVPPLGSPAKVIWYYPSRKPNNLCDHEILPRNSIRVLGARGRASQAISQNRQTSQIFDRIGGVCYLDQRRTVRLFKSFNRQNIEDQNAHSDVLSWLIEYYRKHLTWKKEKYGESYWQRVQRLFNKICFPSELIGLESGPDSDTVILKRKGMEYDLLQMSSG
ncbi:AAA family ATPase [Dolichospermum planctonicum CS-1226]|uniref:AAA family ATPase n=1 Tax=Dolichospermum planctonicum CS-1226 TaxID=3021751 RepID=A0ABT5AEH4_9CYAN|nr:AAA family ATPase [Dolichospermum planctonicum]MDB9535694.1 AAA family ATPase [Dolichospermum planctonicum CS-1226]